jgi:flagellar motor switch/type III secretory pathway protein FliN
VFIARGRSVRRQRTDLTTVNTARTSARPFPWAALESLTQAEADLVRDVRHLATVRLDAVHSAVGQILGTEFDVLVRRAGPLVEAAPFADAVAVLIAPADDPTGTHGVLIEAERGLAAAVVARATKRPPPTVVNPSPPLSPVLAGAFAATVLATARRAHAGLALRIASAGAAEPIETEFGRRTADPVAVLLTIVLGDDAYAARVVLPRGLTRHRQPLPFSTEVLSRLGAVPLTMPIVVCASRATVADVAALRRGDVFVPGVWPLTRTPDGAWHGPAWLAPPDADEGIRIELGDGGRPVLRGHRDRLCVVEADMAGPEEESELVRAVGDIPVVVKVEMGEARMAAREWASLVRGDVVALGRRVGDGVVLRVGGVAVARGELVEIEGEIGVRISERMTSDGTDR